MLIDAFGALAASGCHLSMTLYQGVPQLASMPVLQRAKAAENELLDPCCWMQQAPFRRKLPWFETNSSKQRSRREASTSPKHTQ